MIYTFNKCQACNTPDPGFELRGLEVLFVEDVQKVFLRVTCKACDKYFILDVTKLVGANSNGKVKKAIDSLRLRL